MTAPAAPATALKGLLGNGQLRRQVAEYLTDHPGPRKTGEIAKALDRSAGAVGNALTTLAGRGEADLLPGKPIRYQANSATAAAAAAITPKAPLPPRPAPAPGPAAPAAPKVSSYTGPGISAPAGIAPGPDGALWFTNHGSASLGKITTKISPQTTSSDWTGAPRATPTVNDHSLQVPPKSPSTAVRHRSP
jgi:hypothetical protein